MLIISHGSQSLHRGVFVYSIPTIPEYGVEVIPTYSNLYSTKSYSSIPDCGGLSPGASGIRFICFRMDA